MLGISLRVGFVRAVLESHRAGREDAGDMEAGREPGKVGRGPREPERGGVGGGRGRGLRWPRAVAGARRAAGSREAWSGPRALAPGLPRPNWVRSELGREMNWKTWRGALAELGSDAGG